MIKLVILVLYVSLSILTCCGPPDTRVADAYASLARLRAMRECNCWFLMARTPPSWGPIDAYNRQMGMFDTGKDCEVKRLQVERRQQEALPNEPDLPSYYCVPASMVLEPL
jgi:hypothetical protein